MKDAQEFAYNQGIAPMVWALFALSLIELVVVHLFVALRWPVVGWPLTIVSAIGAVWILFWIRSLRTKPHRISGTQLTLRLGNLKTVELDTRGIKRVLGSWEPGAIKAKDAINLAAIAHPNRCLELAEPLAKGKGRVFVRLDDPEAFDAALRERDVAFA